MERELKNISQRLSLRAPQRESLEILARVAEIVTPGRKPVLGAAPIDAAEALRAIQAQYKSVKSFERDFPSLCFALATGVGKTRLMGAFISYLHVVHGLKHFFVLAPNLTIYNKLIADFTPNTPKYVFQGIAAFATTAPAIITGENYDEKGGLFDDASRVQINIFNISKINSEVRGGKSPKIRKLSEYLGKSYFDYLAGLPDLVMLMDESHRYRASAGIRAINELKPILGLELTATPFVEGTRGAIPFQNVIFDYPLARAMEDGFVKEPAVSTRRNFNAAEHSADEIEKIKLEDGVRMHEHTKVELINYANQTQRQVVKPFLLVIARDTSHARELVKRIESPEFFKGSYKGKVIQVDSSAKSAADEEEMINRLLKVEHTDEPTEIVVHVNMLKEGWDVTNLYTIVPLRAANARILIEQSIGRGLRLPYGMRTGVDEVDRLTIVAHDKFQEIIDEANRKDSPLRLRAIVVDGEELERKIVAIENTSNTEEVLRTRKEGEQQLVIPGIDLGHSTRNATNSKVAQAALEVIQAMSKETALAPTTRSLSAEAVQAEIVKRTLQKVGGVQLVIEGTAEKPDVAAIAAEVTHLVQAQTIDIPRITVVPRGQSRFVFSDFDLDTAGINPKPMDRNILTRELRSDKEYTVIATYHGEHEPRVENHIVRRLMDYPDVDYHQTAALMYKLTGQLLRYLEQSNTADEAAQLIRDNEVLLAKYIYLQMKGHFHVESEGGFETRVLQGYDKLRPSAFTVAPEMVLPFREMPERLSEIRRYAFKGFSKCLYPLQKFDSKQELILSRVLERDSLKWFKPAFGQFQIFYNDGLTQRQYNPDFVAEMVTEILLIEVKDDGELEDAVVVAKQRAAELYCEQASDFAVGHGGKGWRYLILGAGGVSENISFGG